jgi:hypothetical protein
MTKRVSVGKDKTQPKERLAKKTTTIVEQVPAKDLSEDELNDFDVTLEGVDDYEQLQEALAQFGIEDGIVFKVYRVTPTGQSFCYETTEFSEQFLQTERGAGRYAVRIFINGRYKKTIHTEVDAPASGPASGQNQNGTGNAFLEKMVLALIAKDHAPAPAPPSLAELTTAMVNLEQLRGKPDPMNLELMAKMFALFKDMSGDGGALDWKSELLKMGRDAIPAITSVVQSRVNGNGNGQPHTPTSIDGEQPVPVQIDPATMTDEQKKGLLKQAITFLKPQCIQGLPPESVLDFIVANSGNPQYQVMITAVLGYSFEQILEIDHELQSEPFHVFFRTIYDGLRSEFGGDDPVGDDPGRDLGDSNHPGNDGKSSTGGK